MAENEGGSSKGTILIVSVFLCLAAMTAEPGAAGWIAVAAIIFLVLLYPALWVVAGIVRLFGFVAAFFRRRGESVR